MDDSNPGLSLSHKPVARKLFAIVAVGFMLGLTAHTSSQQINVAQIPQAEQQLVVQTCNPDGVCDLTENDSSCSADCQCNNNGTCEPNQEHYISCPGDCPSPGICGDGVCDGEENFENCFLDCLPPTSTKTPTKTPTRTPEGEEEDTPTPSPTATATPSPTVPPTATSTDTPKPATESPEPTETDTPVPPPTEEEAPATPTQEPGEDETAPSLPTSTPITPIMSCNIVGTDDVRDEIRSAVVDTTNNASVTWVLCNDAPTERCLPIVPSDRVMEDLSAVRLIDCNARGECSEFSPIESTEQQLCFQPVSGDTMLDCTNGCALAIEPNRPLILGNVPLWVILLGVVPLGLGIFGLIVFLLSTRSVPDEEGDGYDQDIMYQ